MGIMLLSIFASSKLGFARNENLFDQNVDVTVQLLAKIIFS